MQKCINIRKVCYLWISLAFAEALICFNIRLHSLHKFFAQWILIIKKHNYYKRNCEFIITFISNLKIIMCCCKKYRFVSLYYIWKKPVQIRLCSKHLLIYACPVITADSFKEITCLIIQISDRTEHAVAFSDRYIIKVFFKIFSYKRIHRIYSVNAVISHKDIILNITLRKFHWHIIPCSCLCKRKWLKCTHLYKEHLFICRHRKKYLIIDKCIGPARYIKIMWFLILHQLEWHYYRPSTAYRI